MDGSMIHGLRWHLQLDRRRNNRSSLCIQCAEIDGQRICFLRQNSAISSRDDVMEGIPPTTVIPFRGELLHNGVHQAVNAGAFFAHTGQKRAAVAAVWQMSRMAHFSSTAISLTAGALGNEAAFRHELSEGS